MPPMVPYGCRYCSYGNRSVSTCGIHVDNLLPNFRSARCPQSGPSRNAIYHPLVILQVARSVVPRGIEWDQPNVTPNRLIVLTAFADHIFVMYPRNPHNPYFHRCTPAWWMRHVRLITDMYDLDQDAPAMRRRVNDVLEVAQNMMHDVDYQEPARYGGMPPIPAVNINAGVLGAVGGRGPVGGIRVGNHDRINNGAIARGRGVVRHGVNNLGALAQDGGVVRNGRFAVNNLNGDGGNAEAGDAALPPARPNPRQHRPRRVPEVIVLSSDPVIEDEQGVAAAAQQAIHAVAERAVEEVAEQAIQAAAEEEIQAAAEQAAADALVVFTLAVDAYGAVLELPITVEMELQDALAVAVQASVLAGMDPARAEFVGPGGDVWVENDWVRMWNLSMSGEHRTDDPWAVKLRVVRG